MPEQMTINKLIRILQKAYSSELGAIKAYQGHWKSVKNQFQKEQIKKIQKEEFEHRIALEKMLLELKAKPNFFKEIKFYLIGTLIGFLCYLGGWFIPMYGAGRLESKNVREYEEAARYAWENGNYHFINILLKQAETEWEHEKYFREIIQDHFFNKIFPKWTIPPTKETIRNAFNQYCQSCL